MEYLVISTILPSQDRLLRDIFFTIRKLECSVQDSRITRLGHEYGAILLVKGNWSAIARLESKLDKMRDEEQIPLHFKRTSSSYDGGQRLPYLVQVIGLDNIGLIYEVLHFFVTQDIVVNDLQTNPFIANYTKTTMMTVVMSISIPAELSITDLRERFMILCDDLNVDGILEPEKRL